MVKQRKHIRRSKKGKPFYAGSKHIPKKIQKAIIKQQMNIYGKELKRKGRTRLPEIGILRLKVKKARKSRWGTNPFTGERMRFKAMPRKKVVKFRAAKALTEMII